MLTQYLLSKLPLEITMIDLARIPVRQQATRLNWAEILFRKLRRILAQKGNPELNA